MLKHTWHLNFKFLLRLPNENVKICFEYSCFVSSYWRPHVSLRVTQWKQLFRKQKLFLKEAQLNKLNEPFETRQKSNKFQKFDRVKISFPFSAWACTPIWVTLKRSGKTIWKLWNDLSVLRKRFMKKLRFSLKKLTSTTPLPSAMQITRGEFFFSLNDITLRRHAVAHKSYY